MLSVRVITSSLISKAHSPTVGGPLAYKAMHNCPGTQTSIFPGTMATQFRVSLSSQTVHNGAQLAEFGQSLDRVCSDQCVPNITIGDINISYLSHPLSGKVVITNFTHLVVFFIVAVYMNQNVDKL